ncbi:hypothetical protein [Thiothrix subterranea]|uniref:hypothetical protein n=1 Tax=Thiothrix subterranea TaxID=2735563 RepID=UPI00280A895D|nr:hypothetical protein [Thiothrix subterranea]
MGGYGASTESRLPIAETAYWLEAFRHVYQQPQADASVLITEQTIAAALAEYQRSQVFVNTPWKQYVQGELAAISASAKRGAVLFFGNVTPVGMLVQAVIAAIFLRMSNFAMS